MSRVLGWGANYAGEAIVSLLEDIDSAVPIKMDRWMISSELLEDKDLLHLKSLVCQCDKSFSDDSPSLHEAPKPIRTYSVPARRGQASASSAIASSSSTVPPHDITQPISAATASTPPPSWMSSRRLRFNSVSEIPGHRDHLEHSSSSSSICSSMSSEGSELDSPVASSSSSSSVAQSDPLKLIHVKDATTSLTSTDSSLLSTHVFLSCEPCEPCDSRDSANGTHSEACACNSEPSDPDATESQAAVLKEAASSLAESGIVVHTESEKESPVLDAGSDDWKWAMQIQAAEETTTMSALVALERDIDSVVEDSLLVAAMTSKSPSTPKRKNKKASDRMLAQSDGHLFEAKSRRSSNPGTVDAVAATSASPSSTTPIPLTISESSIPRTSITSESPVESAAPTWISTMKRMPDLRKVRSTSVLKTSSLDLAERRTLVMNNYFSVGVDSMVALEFHNKREASPSLFPHHMINKAWYGAYGLKHAMLNLSKKPELRRVMRLELDGVEVKIPKGVEAIVMLQIPSYSSGTNIWGDSKKLKGQRSPPRVGDGMFEVVGLKGVMHLGALQAGWSSGLRLGQASRAALYNLCVVPVQCDGEPWLLPPCKTVVEFQNQSTMLFNVKGKSAYQRFRTVSGLTLPNMVDPDPTETEDSNSREYLTESSSSDVNAEDLRTHIRDLAPNSFKSTHDVPARVRAASRAITRSYDSIPSVPILPPEAETSAVPVEVTRVLETLPSSRRSSPNKKL